MKAQSILETIGGTPHIRLNRLFARSRGLDQVGARNPGGSIKDRIALRHDRGGGEETASSSRAATIIEPTSGNTGIGLAMVAAVKGYKLVLVMPDSMSVERRRLMQAYGASFELTPRANGMKGSIAKAEELPAATPGALDPAAVRQPGQHRDPCARPPRRRSCADFPEGIDALITGVGTGGHITGCAEVLKAKWPKLKVFAVEPTASPVISGGAALAAPDPGHRRRLHPEQPAHRAAGRRHPVDRGGRQGIRPALGRARRGMLVGISSGATLAAMAQKLPELPAGSARAWLQLRHRGAVFLGARLPAGVIAAGRGD